MKDVLTDVPGLARKLWVRRHLLRRFANRLALDYWAPVYLVGSALARPDPRDIDLRIELPDAEFARRYGAGAEDAVRRWVAEGESGAWSDVRWAWSDDCTRQTRLGWTLTDLNLDVQVYPASWAAARYGGAPKRQLDRLHRDRGDGPRTRVVHVRRDPYDIYVGRASGRHGLAHSPFANPFRIGLDGDRAAVLAQYRAYLLGRPELLAQIPTLRGRVLACWCKGTEGAADVPCHADILAVLADAEEELTTP